MSLCATGMEWETAAPFGVAEGFGTKRSRCCRGTRILSECQLQPLVVYHPDPRGDRFLRTKRIQDLDAVLLLLAGRQRTPPGLAQREGCQDFSATFTLYYPAIPWLEFLKFALELLQQQFRRRILDRIARLGWPPPVVSGCPAEEPQSARMPDAWRKVRALPTPKLAGGPHRSVLWAVGTQESWLRGENVKESPRDRRGCGRSVL